MHEPHNGKEQPSRVVFDLEKQKDQVKLTVTHDDFIDGSKVFESISNGWPLVLSSLKSYLETEPRVLHAPWYEKQERRSLISFVACLSEGRRPVCRAGRLSLFQETLALSSAARSSGASLSRGACTISASCLRLVALAIGAVMSDCAISQAMRDLCRLSHYAVPRPSSSALRMPKPARVERSA